LCPCFGARRVIVGRGSGREQTVFATFGSRGACVGEDFSFAVLLFPQTFLFSFVLHLVVAVAFQGLSFFPLRFRISVLSFFPLYCWYAAHGAVPSVFALASVVADCALSRCGVLALWGSRPMGGLDG